MKKNITILLLFNLFFFFIPLNIKASYDGIITGSSVKIRTGATTSASSIATTNKNTSIIILDTKKITGTGCNDGWYKILYNNKESYVCSTYAKIVDNSFNNINVSDWTARVNSNNVNVRKTASTSSSSLDSLSLGVNVNILGEVSGKTSECSTGKWYKIQYYKDKIGYMCSKYITKKSDITSYDEEYAKTLRKSFPESYIPFLTYLHKKYPKWEFVADNANINFVSAVNAEEGNNLMQTKNDNYRTSSSPAEGSSWFRVNSAVIAFYLDPRNWLTEDRIFMFEKVDEYNTNFESMYPALVKKIFKNGTLSQDKYVNPIISVCKAKGASPLSIASRINLEVGSNGSASTSGGEFTWKGKKYSGYYNFFNIGAYETTIDGVKYSAVQRGLAYAAQLVGRTANDGKPWNNIETALSEGIDFLSGKYIFNGQNTLYFQKFNVSVNSKSTKFTHQYMTNVQAPAVEGNSTYNAYVNSGIQGENFKFLIPVYTNMPEYTSLPNSGDDDNTLSSLSVNGYNLIPDFDADILNYDVYVPTSYEKITINAKSNSSVATVSGIGEIVLDTDDTDITILVKSQTGYEKKYILSVHRVNDTTTSNQVVTNANMSFKNEYLVNVKNSTTANTIITNLTKAGANSVKITSPSNVQINGNNIIGTGYKVTITTLLDTKTFTISVKGDTSGDGIITILDLLQTQKHIKNATKLNGCYSLAADTSGDGQITILDLLQIQKHIKGVKSL